MQSTKETHMGLLALFFALCEHKKISGFEGSCNEIGHAKTYPLLSNHFAGILSAGICKNRMVNRDRKIFCHENSTDTCRIQLKRQFKEFKADHLPQEPQ
jgi:hypothetical protein